MPKHHTNPHNCRHEPKDKPNHLCPFAVRESRAGHGQDLAFIERWRCDNCAHSIKVVTPVDSDRQYLTEAQLNVHGLKVV
jgi:hypothetical protein